MPHLCSGFGSWGLEVKYLVVENSGWFRGVPAHASKALSMRRQQGRALLPTSETP